MSEGGGRNPPGIAGRGWGAEPAGNPAWNAKSRKEATPAPESTGFGGKDGAQATERWNRMDNPTEIKAACGDIISAFAHHVDHREFGDAVALFAEDGARSEEHTSELQSLMRISYAVFCLKK